VSDRGTGKEQAADAVGGSPVRWIRASALAHGSRQPPGSPLREVAEEGEVEMPGTGLCPSCEDLTVTFKNCDTPDNVNSGQ
jgi:hypothetical protein